MRKEVPVVSPRSVLKSASQYFRGVSEGPAQSDRCVTSRVASCASVALPVSSVLSPVKSKRSKSVVSAVEPTIGSVIRAWVLKLRQRNAARKFERVAGGFQSRSIALRSSPEFELRSGRVSRCSSVLSDRRQLLS